jgi:hypothetical protein
MSDAQITPEQPLSVTLSIAQWRVVMETLAGDRLRILQDIERQCNTQIQRLHPPPMMRGNGEEHPGV